MNRRFNLMAVSGVSLGLSLGLLGLLGGGGSRSSEVRRFESLDFGARHLRPEEIRNLSLEDLGRLRGLVFGRHGRIFKEKEIQRYLESRPWYHPDPRFTNSRLTRMERRNLDIIREAEARRHEHVEPGDLRFWSDRSFTKEMLGSPSYEELRVMLAEIEASHGARFDEAPWLQSYFEERYWYRPRRDYDSRSLSDIERHNMQVLLSEIRRTDRVERRIPNVAGRGDSELPSEMIRERGLYELAVMRNGIYAQHGRLFQTPWLRDLFSSQVAGSQTVGGETPLSPVENRNIAKILEREKLLRGVHRGEVPIGDLPEDFVPRVVRIEG